MFKNQEKVKIRWKDNFAYAIGLITADGCLSSDKRHISLSSKDLEMINNLKVALVLGNKTRRNARGGEKEKRYFVVEFGDKVFYQFLNSIGLHSAKSKTIKSVQIPDQWFSSFLRGLFDGDGTFYSSWDKRWPNSFIFKMSFASASPDFVKWLGQSLTRLYGVKGFIRKGDGVFNLIYCKGDSRKLYNAMYYKKNLLYLTRKYDKIRGILERDKGLGKPFLQKQRNAAVAQW